MSDVLEGPLCRHCSSGKLNPAKTRILINGIWFCTGCDQGGWVLLNQQDRRR